MAFAGLNSSDVVTGRSSNLEAALSKLLPGTVRYAISRLDRDIDVCSMEAIRAKYPLTVTEYADVRNSVPTRELEYRVGRYLAKSLLSRKWAIHGVDLYKKQNGGPNWPVGMVGSISHSSRTCIVLVAEQKMYEGLGVDIEEGGKFSNEIEAYISSPGELLRFSKFMEAEASLRAVFCCKEAIFKSLEAYLWNRIGFNDVEIDYSLSAVQNMFKFRFRFTKNIELRRPLDCRQLLGNVFVEGDSVIATAVIPGST